MVQLDQETMDKLISKIDILASSVIRLEVKFEGALKAITDYQSEFSDIKKKINALDIEIAVLKTKMILIGSIAGLAVSLISNFLIKQ